MASTKVKKGDTLSALAKKYKTTVSALAKANGIKDVNKISIGQTIKAPAKAAVPAKKPTASASSAKKPATKNPISGKTTSSKAPSRATTTKKPATSTAKKPTTTAKKPTTTTKKPTTSTPAKKPAASTPAKSTSTNYVAPKAPTEATYKAPTAPKETAYKAPTAPKDTPWNFKDKAPTQAADKTYTDKNVADVSNEFGLKTDKAWFDDLAKQEADITKNNIRAEEVKTQKGLNQANSLIDADYFQQGLKNSQGIADRGLTGGMAVEQGTRLAMSRQAAMGQAYTDAQSQMFKLGQDKINADKEASIRSSREWQDAAWKGAAFTQEYNRDQYGRVKDENDRNLQKYQMETDQYNKNRDFSYGQWSDNRNFNQDKFESDRAFGYQQWESNRDYNRDKFESDRTFGYGQFKDTRDYNREKFESDRSFDYSKWESNRDYTRSVYESDRGYKRGVLESDRTYNRDKFVTDRNYTRGKFESDRTYKRGIVENDRTFKQGQYEFNKNYGLDAGKLQLDKDRFAFDKIQASKVGGSSGGGGGRSYSSGGSSSSRSSGGSSSRSSGGSSSVGSRSVSATGGQRNIQAELAAKRATTGAQKGTQMLIDSANARTAQTKKKASLGITAPHLTGVIKPSPKKKTTSSNKYANLAKGRLW